jgi:hypothetical protein
MNWKLVTIVGKGDWLITIKYNSYSRLAGPFARLAGIGAPKRLNLNRTTVRRYAFAESFPERIRHPTGRSMLTPYLAYLEQRYQGGCHNAQQLWRELCEQGYPGSDANPLNGSVDAGRRMRHWMEVRHLRVSYQLTRCLLIRPNHPLTYPLLNNLPG